MAKYIDGLICILIGVGLLIPMVTGGVVLSQKPSFTPVVSSCDGYDYVIVTTTDLENSITHLKEWKEFLGYSVKVVTISWISSNYQGADMQEKIRNFLIDTYEEWGIHYVLIVGSRNSIPMRDCYPDPATHKNNDPYFMAATDYYYADLTGDWDSDGDGYFGEYSEDNMDFHPEVYVGRIPSDDPDKVEEICQRIIGFESSSGPWKKNALLLGAVVSYENEVRSLGAMHRTDGATLMEECWNDILKPNDFTPTKMYEKEGIRPSEYPCDYPLNESNVLSEWRKGYGIVNMLGHSAPAAVYRHVWISDDGDEIPEITELRDIRFLDERDVSELCLKKPPIVFSGGCVQLYTSRNMGRTFIEDGGAVAFIGSTAISWYNITKKWDDRRDGGSLSIDYYFFHYLINENQKCADALYNAKVYYYEHFGFPLTGENQSIKISAFYQNLYGFNLYGDPSLGLTTDKTDTDPPTVTIEKPGKYLYISDREIIPTGTAIILGNITVSVSAADNLTGIDGIEFYVDDELKATVEGEPYEWLWDERIMGRHTLKAVAYDNAGNTAAAEQRVWIINI